MNLPDLLQYSLFANKPVSDNNLLYCPKCDTNIFIYPGRPFNVTDMLVTNFHLPESTLLMLVSAFAGYQATMAAYRAAVAQEYRFFSYGDAMLITRNPQPDVPKE